MRSYSLLELYEKVVEGFVEVCAGRSWTSLDPLCVSLSVSLVIKSSSEQKREVTFKP